MGVMYDAAGGGIPAAAAEILIPTDGQYAPVGVRLRTTHPNARFHTYSALGQILAEWIDVETGCVWPPATAVARWRQWRARGCKGFYCARSTRTTLTGLLTADELRVVEWFEADPTGVTHVLPGDVATQYLWTPGYDASETTPAFETPAGATPAPAPIPSSPAGTVAPQPPAPAPQEEEMLIAAHPAAGKNGYWMCKPDGSVEAKGDCDYFGGNGNAGIHVNGPVTGFSPTPTGNGYYLINPAGQVYAFGDAKPLGNAV